MRRLLLIAVLMTTLARPAMAGEVGGTLGKYSVAGMGVGALLGSAAATLPYLQSQEPYDFLVGAGLGMLAGAGVGFVLGMVDLANPAATAAVPSKGWALAWAPQRLQARYSLSF
jgi:hypothetical protein